MRIGLVEDDPRDRESLTAVLRACRLASCDFCSSPSEEGQLDSISCFSDGGEFFTLWQPGDFDVLFLDCYLPGDETGLDVARRVRSAGDEVPIVFVTSSVDFAVEGYDVGAVGYVLKPAHVDAVASTLERAAARRAANVAAADAAADAAAGGAVGGVSFAAGDAAGGPSGGTLANAGNVSCSAAGRVIEVPGAGGLPVAVDLHTLRWCTSSGHYLDMALERPDGSLQVVRARMRFKDLLDAVSDIPSLYSCMRGCLVDLAFVVSLEGRDFVLRDGTRMPVSRQSLSGARDRFAEQVFSQMREDQGGGRHVD